MTSGREERRGIYGMADRNIKNGRQTRFASVRLESRPDHGGQALILLHKLARWIMGEGLFLKDPPKNRPQGVSVTPVHEGANVEESKADAPVTEMDLGSKRPAPADVQNPALDVSQGLKDAENSLRDFIAYIMEAKHGRDWEEKCGVTPERLVEWKERKETEKKRQRAGANEERLIYFADFYDLETILQKNWNDFTQAFGELREMKVWLRELGRLRDPEAHRRELLPHQKHLILGLSGQIRNLIVRYRSKRETAEDYYPRIESAHDNLGNSYPSDRSMASHVVTDMVLRVGDHLEFVVTASDPMGEPLKYRFRPRGDYDRDWQVSNTMSFELGPRHVGNEFFVWIEVRSEREFHAKDECDDTLSFSYKVLPRK